MDRVEKDLYLLSLLFAQDVGHFGLGTTPPLASSRSRSFLKGNGFG